jgi:hypothetical protein
MTAPFRRNFNDQHPRFRHARQDLAQAGKRQMKSKVQISNIPELLKTKSGDEFKP